MFSFQNYWGSSELPDICWDLQLSSRVLHESGTKMQCVVDAVDTYGNNLNKDIKLSYADSIFIFAYSIDKIQTTVDLPTKIKI